MRHERMEKIKKMIVEENEEMNNCNYINRIMSSTLAMEGITRTFLIQISHKPHFNASPRSSNPPFSMTLNCCLISFQQQP